ncbi:MAG: hypothetical protein ABIR35_11990 [Polaromonas sp.]
MPETDHNKASPPRRPGAAPEILPDDPQRKEERYPLGVLFVHGIGNQPRGDTLTRFVDPVVKCLDLWINGVASKHSRTLPRERALDWANEMHTSLRQIEHSMSIRMEAYQLAWDLADADESLGAAEKELFQRSTVWSGGAVLRDGVLPHASAAPAFPPHARLDMHLMDEGYQVAEASVLVAESWWAQSFVAPSPASLFAWTFKILPLALGMHCGDAVRRHAARAGSAQLGYWRRALALVRTLFSGALMVLTVPFAPVIQALLTATLVVGLIPVRPLQAAMRAIRGVLAGTLGDSFLLTASPTSRATMVGQFKRDLAWLGGRCDDVIVVAHSQGCAVSYLGLCERLPGELHSVVWLGSGLRKLEVLRGAERRLAMVGSGWFVAVMPVAAFLLVQLLLQSQAWDQRLVPLLLLLLAAAAYLLGFLMLVTRTQPKTISTWVALLTGLDVKFFDIFASHDPVPNGPLFESASDPTAGIETRQVSNRASRLSDHTSYWNNVEDVVLPLALLIGQTAGLPLDKLYRFDPEWVRQAQRRRAHRVACLVWLRLAFWASCTGLVMANARPWLALLQAAWAGSVSWLSDGDADLVDLAEVREAAFAVVPSAVFMGLALAALLLVWRGWDLHEQRRFLARESPGVWTVFGLTLLAVLSVAAPLLFAGWTRWGGRPLAWFYIGLLVSFFFALVYVFQYHSPQKMRLPTGDGETPP